MSAVTVKGVVFSGEGKASQFVEISWAKKQIEKKLGFKPYVGTLNIRLSRREANHLRDILEKSRHIEIVPPTGFYAAHCFKAVIMNKIRGAVVIPQKPGYPSNVLEVTATVYLREALSLKDGDPVELTIFLNNDTKA